MAELYVSLQSTISGRNVSAFEFEHWIIHRRGQLRSAQGNQEQWMNNEQRPLPSLCQSCIFMYPLLHPISNMHHVRHKVSTWMIPQMPTIKVLQIIDWSFGTNVCTEINYGNCKSPATIADNNRYQRWLHWCRRWRTCLQHTYYVP
jgi:hypothetical protein